MNRIKWAGIAVMVALAGCSGNSRLDADVSDVDLRQVKIRRYDLDLFRVDRNHLQKGLESLRPAYPFFLGTDLSDSSKLSGMKDYLDSPRNRVFHDAVAARFPEVDAMEEDLTRAFRHYQYYYPGSHPQPLAEKEGVPVSRIPHCYAYISGGDYEFPVQFADSVMLIGLDNFLGPDFKPYKADGLPSYVVDRMTPDHVVPECMKVLYKVTVPGQLPGNNLLEQMVDAGKRLLFIDAMIPRTDDRLKIGYSQSQYDWIVKNEKHVWAAIIDNRMLYTTDGKLIRSFMADGPFTPEFSKDSPPRLGEWIGWKIVKDYYENQPNVTLQDLMQEKDAQKILTKSGFKPEK